jgi:hypothetical protein
MRSFSVATTKKMSLRDATKRFQKLQSAVRVLEIRLTMKEAELAKFRAENADLLGLPRGTVSPRMASQIERVTKGAITKDMLLPVGRGKSRSERRAPRRTRRRKGK